MGLRYFSLAACLLLALPAYAGPPVITSASGAQFNEGEANSFTVTADGDPAPTFSITSGSLPDGVSLDAGSGVISGTPVDANASYEITLQASNGMDPVATQAFTLTVDRVPRVNDFTANGFEDQELLFQPPAGTIFELDGQDITVRIESLPANGLLFLEGSEVSLYETFNPFTVSSFTFVPSANWSGVTTFDYSASDGSLTSGLATVTVDIAAVNDAPVIDQGTEGDYEIDEEGVLTQLLTATDVESDPFTWAVSVPASSGVATVLDGNVEYTPNADFAGEDSFTVAATDSNDGVGAHVFTVTVNPVNDAPVITQGVSVAVVMDEDSAPRGFDVSIDAVDVDGDVLTWTLQSAASVGVASVSGTGSSPVVDYVPAANASGSDSFVVRVDDGQGEQADITVEVTVDAVNDPPVITGVPSDTAVEGVPYSFTPGVTDVEGDDISWQVLALPSWAGFDTDTGAVTGTPVQVDIGLYENITVRADDGTDTTDLIFSIQVLSDLDGDTVPDIDDDDIDGDGMDNAYEEAAGLDPRDPSDANGDLDGDGVSNLDEYLAGSDAAVDDYPPEVTPPADVYADAQGLFTLVSLGDASAVDALDGALVPTPARQYFSPGAHTVVWQATDAAGNVGEAVQNVFVRPQVSFGPPRVSAEGATVTVALYLNGDAATYPVMVPFTLSGTTSQDGSDHDLVAGTAEITSGLQGSVTFSLVGDGPGEGTEQLVLTMGDPVNAVPGMRTEQLVSVREDNVVPEVSLQVRQDGTLARTLMTTGGQVVVTALIDDANTADVHDFDWSGSSGMLVDLDASNDTFTFDPALLSVGTYVIDVSVSDGALISSASIAVDVLASEPVLAAGDSDGDGVDDVAEGYGDSDQDGVRNDLDAIDNPSVLQGVSLDDEFYLHETEPGLVLALGQGALRTSAARATVTPQAVADAFGVALPGRLTPIAQDSFVDIAMSGLGEPGQVAFVVLPQQTPLPEEAAIYLLTTAGWTEFVADGANTIASAPGHNGYCPPPASDQYSPLLAEGDTCVRLGVEEGGSFDGDGIANAAIAVRGGVVQVSKGGSSGGGGALSLTALVWLLFRRRSLSVG